MKRSMRAPARPLARHSSRLNGLNGLNKAKAAVLVAALCLAAQPAAAQMADALGKPLQVADLEVGTVTVRVVDGTPSKPMVGVDVSLVDADAPDTAARTARTDAEGRATFNRLKPGNRYVVRASAAQGDGAQVGQQGGQGAAEPATSEPFEVPASGGLRILLSTSPWQMGAGAGAGGMGPGMPGMPDPRQMSGVPRPQPGDPAGTLTIRVVQGEMARNVADHPVHLVAYGADGSTNVITQRTDVGGRAVFEGLVPDRVAYYATTVLPRENQGQTVFDRVRSGVVMMPPEVGMRLLLAGEKPGSGMPPVDDMDRVEQQSPSAAADEVIVRLYGQTAGLGEVDLMRLSAPGAEPVPVTSVSAGASAPFDVIGTVDDAVQMPTLADGSLAVAVLRSTGSGAQPVAGARVEVEPVPAADDPAGTAAPVDPVDNVPAPQVTGPEGMTQVIGLVPGRQYRLVATVHGARVQGAPFSVPLSGGLRQTVAVTWRELSTAEARFRGLSLEPEGVYMARVSAGDGKSFVSAPFQPAPGRSATVRMVVIDAVKDLIGFSFHVQGWIDDVYMGFQGQLTLHNWSYAPWDPGPEGLVVPLPAGFVGAQVEDEMSHRVAVDPDRGLLWRGALPPGGAQFIMAFSLPVADGGVQFDMPLPLGAMNSLLALRHTPGMTVDMPVSEQGRFMDDSEGRRHYVVRGINIAPMQRMVLSVKGLPQPSQTQRVLRWAVGGAVLCLLAWGVWGIAAQRRREREEPAAGSARDQGSVDRQRKLKKRREHLLDELVALESRKDDMGEEDYRKRRGKLTRQLEVVYLELEASRSGTAGPPA